MFTMFGFISGVLLIMESTSTNPPLHGRLACSGCTGSERPHASLLPPSSTGFEDYRSASVEAWNQDVSDWNAHSREAFATKSFTLDSLQLEANRTVTTHTPLAAPPHCGVMAGTRHTTTPRRGRSPPTAAAHLPGGGLRSAPVNRPKPIRALSSEASFFLRQGQVAAPGEQGPSQGWGGSGDGAPHGGWGVDEREGPAGV